MAPARLAPDPSGKAILDELIRISDLLAMQLAFHRPIHDHGWSRTVATGPLTVATLYTNTSSIDRPVIVLAATLGEAGLATWAKMAADRAPSTAGDPGSAVRWWRFHAENPRLNLILRPNESLYHLDSDATVTWMVGVSTPYKATTDRGRSGP